ncbi:MAG: DegV family protein [Candidatus Heimdallarchaeaceae archaeon]
MKIKLVTDASALMPKKFMEDEKIAYFESILLINEESIRELTELNRDEFINKLSTVDPYPTTSQMMAQDAVDVYEQAIKDGYDEILYVGLTPLISSQMNVARLAAKRFKGKIKITHYDTDLTCGSQGAMAYRALELLKKGKSVEEITNHLDKLKEDVYTVGMTGDTISLFKTGKVKRGSAKGIMVTLFNMKPIAEVNTEEGFIGIGAAFSEKSAMKKMIKEIAIRTHPDKEYDLFMADALNPELMEWYVSEIKKVRKIKQTFYWEMSGVMALSAGRGAVTATISPSLED